MPARTLRTGTGHLYYRSASGQPYRYNGHRWERVSARTILLAKVGRISARIAVRTARAIGWTLTGLLIGGGVVTLLALIFLYVLDALPRLF